MRILITRGLAFALSAWIAYAQGYVLGPLDHVNVRVLEAQEIAEKSVHIDTAGDLDLPLAGKIHAAGLTVEQLRDELTVRLKEYIRDPHVVVSLLEVASQPVSVIGAVAKPGVLQLQGSRNLAEVLSLAGGVKPEAGNTVNITRRLEYGRIPLPGAQDDASGQFSVATLKLSGIVQARNPEQNIAVKPHDVISVPAAKMVYVAGGVAKPGGVVLNDRERITALQALSLVGGLRSDAAPQSARILRKLHKDDVRTEIALNLRDLLSGKTADQELQPEDILFIPGAKAKWAGIRALEAMISLGTGMATYRRQ